VGYRPHVQVNGAGYSALCVPGRERHPPVRAFFQWVEEEARLSGHALKNPVKLFQDSVAQN
jgi:DNA-binding transcriptional LysR family regulator